MKRRRRDGSATGESAGVTSAGCMTHIMPPAPRYPGHHACRFGRVEVQFPQFALITEHRASTRCREWEVAVVCRVMLVDDSEADLLFTRIVLERAGEDFEVLSFEEARAALDCLRSDGPRVDLILLDINMPGMNGFEFLDVYRGLPQARRDGAAVVMLSSSADPADRERAMAYDCVAGYLTKPLDASTASDLRRQVPD